jgi:hypothetical protein
MTNSSGVANVPGSVVVGVDVGSWVLSGSVAVGRDSEVVVVAPAGNASELEHETTPQTMPAAATIAGSRRMAGSYVRQICVPLSSTQIGRYVRCS